VEGSGHAKAGFVTWTNALHDHKLSWWTVFFIAQEQAIIIWEVATPDSWDSWAPRLDAITKTVVVTPIPATTRDLMPGNEGN
jgi:hypothetical protein